jgi:hypothetical protein
VANLHELSGQSSTRRRAARWLGLFGGALMAAPRSLFDLRNAAPLVLSQFQSAALKRVIRWAMIAACLALPGWVLWRLSLPMFPVPLGYDEQVFVWGGWSVLKGLAPYRDFLEWKPPVAFLTHAVSLKLFGFQGQHFRYFFFLLCLSSIVALLLSLVKRGADVVVCSAFGLALVAMLLHPGSHDAYLADTESIGISYYYLGVAALIANTRFRGSLEILGGICFTLSGLSKEPFIPCIVATWASCYFVVNDRLIRRTALQYLKYTTIGVAVVVGGLCLYMVPTGAMAAYIALIRRYATMFADVQKGYCVVLGLFHPTGRFWDDLPMKWERIHGDFLNTSALGFLAPFFAASLVLVPRRSIALFVTALTAVALAFYGVTATHCYFPHYYIIGESGLMFFLAIGVDSLGSRLALGDRGVRLWARSVFFLAMWLVVWPRLEAVSGVVLKDGPPLAEPVAGIFEFIRENSTPSDKIFTTGPPGLYVVVDRLPAIRGCTIIDELLPAMPGETDSEKLRPLYEELARGQPKIVFLDPENGPRKRRHMAGAIGPFLTDFKYQKVNEYLYVRP